MVSTILNFLKQQRGSHTWARERIFTTSCARSPSSSCVMRLHNFMLNIASVSAMVGLSPFIIFIIANNHYRLQRPIISPSCPPASTAAPSSSHNPAVIIITISGLFTTRCFAVWEMWPWILVFILWWEEVGGRGWGWGWGQWGAEDRVMYTQRIYIFLFVVSLLHSLWRGRGVRSACTSLAYSLYIHIFAWCLFVGVVFLLSTPLLPLFGVISIYFFLFLCLCALSVYGI